MCVVEMQRPVMSLATLEETLRDLIGRVEDLELKVEELQDTIQDLEFRLQEVEQKNERD